MLKYRHCVSFEVDLPDIGRLSRVIDTKKDGWKIINQHRTCNEEWGWWLDKVGKYVFDKWRYDDWQDVSFLLYPKTVKKIIV